RGGLELVRRRRAGEQFEVRPRQVAVPTYGGLVRTRHIRQRPTVEGVTTTQHRQVHLGEVVAFRGIQFGEVGDPPMRDDEDVHGPPRGRRYERRPVFALDDGPPSIGVLRRQYVTEHVTAVLVAVGASDREHPFGAGRD